MSFRNFLVIIVLLLSCNHIQSGESLSSSDIQHIRQLQLLDSGEKIYQFYSEYKKKLAGNFFTDKRLASYWIDEHDSSKNSVSSALYSEISSIDTVYYAGATWSPYMMVTKKDGDQFRVCADGKKQAIRSFFETAIGLWRKSRTVK